jgi:hypothetical protein
MPRLPRRTVPIWFLALVGLLAALLLPRIPQAPAAAGGPLDPAGPPVALAWGWLILVAQWVWTGFQVAARITLKFLAWSVARLWDFATIIADGAGQLAVFAWTGLKKTWDFFRLTYRSVLKPAWLTLWKFVDRARAWLETLFKPVFEFLRQVRDEFLKFYTHWVRPILDTIDAARRILRVLGSLGLDWAKALDRKLAEIADLIDRPFRLLLAKINEVINVVNRIVTADGLFQRLALIRSIERDLRIIGWTFLKATHKPLTPEQKTQYNRPFEEKTFAAHLAEVRAYVESRSGPLAPRVNEWIADVKLRLVAAR